MSRQAIATALTLVFATLPAAAVPRYAVDTELKAAGSIAGTVRLDGTPPAPRTLKTSGKDKACHAAPVPDESAMVAGNGGIRWAVVSIRKISKGKPLATGKPITLQQKGCRFRPHVVVVPVGEKLEITNEDGILHNVHITARRNRSKNVAMTGAQRKLTLKFRRPERMRVKCDAHPWMGAWIIAAGHPYYAVTDADGAFRLDKVPAGTYRLEVWHEKYGKLEREVTVKPGREASVAFLLPAK